MSGAIWKPLSIVLSLLCLLTYLLIRSQSPDPTRRVRMHEALRTFERHDADLNRDVLLARAELLVHYDTLARAIDGLYQALETLQAWEKAASKDAAAALGRHILTL